MAIDGRSCWTKTLPLDDHWARFYKASRITAIGGKRSAVLVIREQAAIYFVAYRGGVSVGHALRFL